MQRINTPNGQFKEETIPNADWYNGVQEAISIAIEKTGVRLDHNNKKQLLQAINKIIKSNYKDSPRGDRGSVGPIGLQGIQGKIGTKGKQGGVGVVGIQGTQGPQGKTGAQGKRGPVGPIGLQGIQGKIGSKGKQGVRGVAGHKGEPGIEPEYWEKVRRIMRKYIRQDVGHMGNPDYWERVWFYD